MISTYEAPGTFLGPLDYEESGGNIGFCQNMHFTHYQVRFKIWILHSKTKKKILPICEKNIFFCRN